MKEIVELLDMLTIEQKKELIAFLRSLQEGECNQSLSSDSQEKVSIEAQ